jgi:iron(III) transport system substrate-binding protein
MSAAPTADRNLWPMVIAVLAIVAGIGVLLISRGPAGGGDALVVYCAHDSVYSEEILRKFERETRIPVSIRFDTEATKSLGLVNLLIAEQENPRCDVFWNNEVLGTIDLMDQGVLAPYRGPGHERIPAPFKNPEGYWTGFGARLRVFIVNTDQMPATEQAIDERLQGDLSRMAIAKPLYGTTLTHYSLLWHLWGSERLKTWHREAQERGLQVVSGNATVKNLVAAGTCDFGWTDSDDFFVAKDERLPVEMLPVRVENGGGGATISIPNSVAIIKGTSRMEQAQRLVDFLLSAETELALSKSNARQIPLGPIDESQLSEEVRQLKTWAADGYDLNPLAQARTECLQWLKSEYLE